MILCLVSFYLIIYNDDFMPCIILCLVFILYSYCIHIVYFPQLSAATILRGASEYLCLRTPPWDPISRQMDLYCHHFHYSSIKLYQ